MSAPVVQKPSASPAAAASQSDAPDRGVSPWRDAWQRLRRNHLAVFGGAVLITLSLLCVIGPWFSPYGYEQTDLYNTFSPPSFKHWLGTDQLGRDLLTRLLFGGRISIMVGLVATFVALTIGVVYGAISGYAGGKIDRLMMRIVDILYALPFTIFVILLTVLLETPAQILDAWIKNLSLGEWQPFINTRGASRILLLFVAIGAVEWLTMARIVRGQIMSIKRMDYIEAARSLGLGTPRIIFRHMIPNILGPIIVYTTLTIPGVMLLEAFLSFLGLGVQPPMSSWGVLIKDGAERMEEYPWMLIFPGTIFSLTLFSLNFLGDGLRDALDVRAAKD
jgi:oligopeptide transport system permease protein